MNVNLIIALVAVVLAAFAFVISFFQLLLEYMSSSASRNLCSYSAIGATAKQVRYGWNFRAWKLRIFYPAIRMEPKSLLLLSLFSRDASVRSAMRGIGQKDGWIWRTRGADETVHKNDIADDFSVLVRRDGKREERIAKTSDLTWREYIRFKWYRLRRPLDRMARTRSSWAQIISALRINDTRLIRIDFDDAETVPTALDTAIQRVKLRKMGVLAFALGFHSVELDIPSRHFRAISLLGTISIHQDNVVGKVLRFQGDVLAIRSLIGRCTPEWIIRGMDMIEGQLSFGKYVVSSTYYPLRTLSRAILGSVSSRTYDKMERKDVIAGGRGFSVGAVYLEAQLMKRYLSEALQKIHEQQKMNNSDPATGAVEFRKFGNLYDNPENNFRDVLLSDRAEFKSDFEGAMALWQTETGIITPTLYVASTFMTIHAVVCAYPSRSLLLPFLPWVRQRAKSLSQMSSPHIRISIEFEKQITGGHFPFARETDPYLMDMGKIRSASDNGTYGWGVTQMKEVYDVIPPELQREIVPNEQEAQANAVLTPSTAGLLRRFQLQQWSASIHEGRQAGLLDYRAVNCLWIQIIILDVAIQYCIRGGWKSNEGSKKSSFKKSFAGANNNDHNDDEDNDEGDINDEEYHNDDDDEEKNKLDKFLYCERWTMREAETVSAVVQAWQNHQKADKRFDPIRMWDDDNDYSTNGTNTFDQVPKLWNLQTALEDCSEKIFASDEGGLSAIDRSSRCKRVADLLELRAIFVIAFLFLHPDSSDIYESSIREDDVEMPMA